jgi:hypothetical protein
MIFHHEELTPQGLAAQCVSQISTFLAKPESAKAVIVVIGETAKELEPIASAMAAAHPTVRVRIVPDTEVKIAWDAQADADVRVVLIGKKGRKGLAFPFKILAMLGPASSFPSEIVVTISAGRPA